MCIRDSLKASLLFESLDERVFRIKITDSQAERWEVPIYNPDARKYYKQHLIKDMGLTYTSPPYKFELADPRTKQVFVATTDTTDTTLYLSDKLIEYGLWFPGDAIFGLGERVNPSFELCDGPYRDCTYTSFNKDIDMPVDRGHPPGGKQSYGHQSFYMVRLKNKQFVGVFFLNSNAQDTIIKRRSTGINVNHKTIGGIVDIYFFYPGAAEEVIKSYHSFIGRPYLPPMWTLGFHQCRWGWKTLDKVKSVVKEFGKADIPLDVVWADIDYMQDFKDFTVNNVTYKGLGEYVDQLHTMGMRWVPIIDAGLKYELNDIYYKKGEEMNAFVRSAYTKKTLIGKVWPGYAVYPAWMNVNASILWYMGLQNLYDQVKYDGIWIDMNEASNFCHGECGLDNTEGTDGTVHGADPHDPKEFDNLRYYPGDASLLTKAISPSGYHVVTDPYGDKFYKEFNLHSLWALHQANVTSRFFTNVQKRRPFIMTRANFAGIGMFSSKWLGDNHSTWEDMQYSIIGMFNYQLFGIPLVGADICGFIFNTTEELCARWMQLGAFSPFSRNHNVNNAKDQEPYNWPLVAKAGRNALRQKYSILRYYYTKLFEVSLHGGTLVKPLFFDYPEDDKAYEYRNKVFMIGPAVLVVPVLEPGAMKVTTYLPNQNWFNLFTAEQIYYFDPKAKEGKEITLKAGFDYVNVLIKGGNILSFQEALKEKVKRVAVLDNLPLEVVVAPDEKGEAKGNMIFDSEKAVNPIASKEYTEITFEFSMKTMKMNINTTGKYRMNKQVENFNTLTILGAESMAHVRYACIRGKSGKLASIPGVYLSAAKKLVFHQNNGIYWGNIVCIAFTNNCFQ
eukprot:TRINITY_DN1688_c0_g1_i11.p1 TRINITY_DN1688_c0_g1~~TRINITY_DN1688_c0_g1_i11.p1  ORF type:complete len:843 (+),score=232.08 TRINITY_DN1688_c0_g1_i11:71-2599(+)